jgi:hypothetical protein
MHGPGDGIADALIRLHSAGWSLGDTVLFGVRRGGIVHVVIGTNGEDLIHAEGKTAAEAWHEALGQAGEGLASPGVP